MSHKTISQWGEKKKHIMKYHFTPTGMTIINTDNDKFGQGNGKLELAHTAGGNVKRQSLWKTICPFLKNLNIVLSALPLLCVY